MYKPDWLGGAYNWTPSMGHGYDNWSPEAQARVQQQWWRDPGWGGHVIWNPNWGFQDLETVQNFYRDWDPSTTPKFHKAFKQAGFQKQLSDVGNWSQYYNDPAHRVVPHWEKMGWSGPGGPQQQMQWGQQQPYQWGTQQPATPQYGSTAETQTGDGFYAPRYGSTTAQYRQNRASRPAYGSPTTPSQGKYYGRQKKSTSMRYGYKPSM